MRVINRIPILPVLGLCMLVWRSDANAVWFVIFSLSRRALPAARMVSSLTPTVAAGWYSCNFPWAACMGRRNVCFDRGVLIVQQKHPDSWVSSTEQLCPTSLAPHLRFTIDLVFTRPCD